MKCTSIILSPLPPHLKNKLWSHYIGVDSQLGVNLLSWEYVAIFGDTFNYHYWGRGVLMDQR